MVVNVPAEPNDLPVVARDWLATVTFLSSATSGQRQLRGDGWLATFAYLHHALAGPEFDTAAWAGLATVLPAAPDWDRCLRLRHGAVAEVRRDRWLTTDTETLPELPPITPGPSPAR